MWSWYNASSFSIIHKITYNVKKVSFILIAAIGMMSCDNSEIVRTPENAKFRVKNNTGIYYKAGDTVCVRKGSLAEEFSICADGVIKDTIYIIDYKYEGQERTAVIEHKKVIITKQ